MAFLAGGASAAVAAASDAVESKLGKGLKGTKCVGKGFGKSERVQRAPRASERAKVTPVPGG